ncbi:MAG: tetratricopeptide repeat protein [Candidatus Tritonobacter lacicola]|nr:tetratricopeptide repeat protein [Candidatus Tritonobacter lacicola]
MGKRLQTAISIAGIVLFAIYTCSRVAAEDGPKEMYKASYKSLLEGEMAQAAQDSEKAAVKWDEALEKLRELQKAHPDWNRLLVESKIRECEAALRKEKGDQPSKTVKIPESGEKKPAALEKKPSEIEQHLAAGNELAGAKKYEEAIAEYEKALSIDPNCGIAYVNTAACYESMDKDDDAVRVLKKAIQNEPDYARAHFNLGRIYLKKDMIDMAVSEYRGALKANPDDPEAHWEIAGMYFMIKKLDDSIKHYDRAAELFGETTPEGLEAIRNSEKIKLLKKEMGVK